MYYEELAHVIMEAVMFQAKILSKLEIQES